jgi:hypothetical protein
MPRAGIKNRYRRAIRQHGEPVLFRRYTGTGSNRPMMNWEVRGWVQGYQPQELIGSIVQGDRKVILLAEDVNRAQIGLPISTSDKLVVRGRELAIGVVDDSTHRNGTELVAYRVEGHGLMARTRCQFTQEAMTRLLRAAATAGVEVRIEIERDGRIIVLPAGSKPVEPAANPVPADQIVL